jgi:hypothetical protein
MTFECGTPFIQQRMEDKETLEGMVDGMSLKGVLTLLEEIACEKAEHLRDIEDWQLAREWAQTGWKIGKWIGQL